MPRKIPPLTRRQHIYPARSINRFYDDSGTVEVFRKGLTFRAKSTNAVFVTVRTWDQRAEGGYMKSIEDNFQEIVERILGSGHTGFLTDLDRKNICRFIAIWHLRHYYHLNPLPEENIFRHGIEAVEHYSEQEIELLERHHIIAIGPTGAISSQAMSGTCLQDDMSGITQSLLHHKWVLLTSNEHEFVVPDRPNRTLVIPVSPNQILTTKLSSETFMGSGNVALINKLQQLFCHEYVFARNIKFCPGII